MSSFLDVGLISLAVALATTVDDNLYLTSFFARVDPQFRPYHVVVGEYLGVTALLGLSLLGLGLGFVVSEAWLGLLGFLPISIGLSQLLDHPPDTSIAILETTAKAFKERQQMFPKKQPRAWMAFLEPETYQVAAVTLANGGNNLGIYLPLFAASGFLQIEATVLAVYGTVTVWLALSYWVVHLPQLSQALTHVLPKIFPLILIGLGLKILLTSHAYVLVSQWF